MAEAEMEARNFGGQDIVKYFCDNDAYLESLASKDLQHMEDEIRELPSPCMDLLAEPDRTLELLRGEDNEEALRKLQKCIRLFGQLYNKCNEFRSSKVSECMVELVLWMLKSSDGNLESWQKELQSSLDEFIKEAAGFEHKYSQDSLSDDEKKVLEKYRTYSDKDYKKHYDSFVFLNAYAKKEMPKKRRIIHATLSELIRQLSKGTGEFRVLSLGCGPGSDLLAVLDGWEASGSQRRIECVGVDQQWWPRGAFLVNRPPSSAISFVQEDIDSFVRSTQQRFDLVLLSFVGVGNLLKALLTVGLQSLLKDTGVVFVMDKYSADVVKLTNLKFRPTEAGLSNVQVKDGISMVLEDDNVPSVNIQAQFAFQPTAVWLKNDRDAKPIMIGLSMRKNQAAIMCDVRVFYVAEKFVDMKVQKSNMKFRMQLDALVLSAQNTASRDIEQKFKAIHSGYTWTCKETTDEEPQAEDGCLYLLFLRVESSHSSQKKILLLGKKTQTSISGIECGIRQLEISTDLAETEVAKNPVPATKVTKREEPMSDRQPARSTRDKYHVQDDQPVLKK